MLKACKSRVETEPTYPLFYYDHHDNIGPTADSEQDRHVVPLSDNGQAPSNHRPIDRP